MKRPNAEIGTFKYWRLELREFWMLTEPDADVTIEQLDLAFKAMFHLAGKTDPEDAGEKMMVKAEVGTVFRRYEKAHFRLMLADVDRSLEMKEMQNG